MNNAKIKFIVLLIIWISFFGLYFRFEIIDSTLIVFFSLGFTLMGFITLLEDKK